MSGVSQPYEDFVKLHPPKRPASHMAKSLRRNAQDDGYTTIDESVVIPTERKITKVERVTPRRAR